MRISTPPWRRSSQSSVASAVAIDGAFNAGLLAVQILVASSFPLLIPLGESQTMAAVYRNDYAMIMGIAIYSIIGVATAVFIIDLLYPLFDPRVRYQ